MAETPDDVVERIWRELCEKTDRTSPAEYPDMALITLDELRAAGRVFVEWERDRPIRGFTVPEITEIGKAILPHLSTETNSQIGAIAFDVSVAVTRILRARNIQPTNPDDCNPSDYT